MSTRRQEYSTTPWHGLSDAGDHPLASAAHRRGFLTYLTASSRPSCSITIRRRSRSRPNRTMGGRGADDHSRNGGREHGGSRFAAFHMTDGSARISDRPQGLAPVMFRLLEFLNGMPPASSPESSTLGPCETTEPDRPPPVYTAPTANLHQLRQQPAQTGFRDHPKRAGGG